VADLRANQRGSSGRSAPFIVGPPPVPTVSGYTWTTTPMPNQPFSGTLTGTGFVSPMSVWFCPGSGSCQQLPGSQVTINDTTSASLSNVSLASGSWRIYVQTTAVLQRVRRRSRWAPAPTVTWYAWTTTPMPNQPFGGTIADRGSSPTCPYGSAPVPGSCLELAASQVTVNSAAGMDVTNVSLAAGSWQDLRADRGRPFGAFHAIYGGGGADGHRLQWTTLPMPNQPFGGTITGLGSAPLSVCGFCPLSGSCQQFAGTQVTINDPTSLSVTNVSLATGSWQFYVQTSGGPSGRSTPFVVGPVTPAIPATHGLPRPCRISPSAGRLRGPDSSPRSPYGSASAGAVAHNWRPRSDGERPNQRERNQCQPGCRIVADLRTDIGWPFRTLDAVHGGSGDADHHRLHMDQHAHGEPSLQRGRSRGLGSSPRSRSGFAPAEAVAHKCRCPRWC